MAGPFDDSEEDRTESPTQYRRDEFRKQGIVAMSREVLSIALLLSAMASIYIVLDYALPEFRHLTEVFLKFDQIETMTKTRLFELAWTALVSWSWLVLPVFGAGMVVAVLVCGAQVGFQISWEPLTPRWERLNPVQGFGRIASTHGMVEAGKAIVKISIGGIIVWFFLNSKAPESRHFFEKDVIEICVYFGRELSKLFFMLVGTFSVLAAVDYFYQWNKVEKQMRMSRREIKEEFKLREGDPLVRSRIRAVQRKIANKRMMEAVPKADVIVTNPTHISIALKYDPEEMAAPKVLAKGADIMAMKIRELAKKHSIPLVENKPLARSLFKEVEIGQYVPRELYKAVAQVLAYVYRLRNESWYMNAQPV